MDHRVQQQQATTNHGCAEPAARSRWAPRPEQILILESIFNSGTVNPAKDETARIRRLLERFGAVRDANVFYWFQNRRSRSRRRARQLQQTSACGGAGAIALPCQDTFYTGDPPLSMPMVTAVTAPTHASADDDLFAISRQMCRVQRGSAGGAGRRAGQCAAAGHAGSSSSTVTVSINGVPCEVPSAAPLHMGAAFGRSDAVLVHSSGEVLPVNECGVLMKSLQMGECYFLVSRST